MPRRLRIIKDRGIYHVLNRRVGRLDLFEDDLDYAAFEKVLAEASQRVPVAILAYVLMPNHWHLLLQPSRGKDLKKFMQWLTVTHMRRWHAHRKSAGQGPVYQGRYKSFPVQEDAHFRTVFRYVERNPLRAKLVTQAQAWRWSSLWRRENNSTLPGLAMINDLPVSLPADYLAWINAPQTDDELRALRNSVARGTPFGSPNWTTRTASAQKLNSSLNPPWRPKTVKRK